MELCDMRSDAIPELLGEVIHPAPGQNVNHWNRDNMILIGLGGMGVRTLNRMKAELQKRFAPGWEDHVRFLALESGSWGLRRSGHLEPWEKMSMDMKELVRRIQDREPIPETIKKLLSSPEQEQELRDYTLEFVDSRVGSKLRLYAPDTAERYWDVEIVEKLRQLYRKMGPSQRTWGDYEGIKIYVIASLAGNFGSGAVTELPALVRRAVEDPKKLRICLDGIFYTPVQTAFLAQGDGDREMMFARGYAALKELKYYQGIRDRSGFCELFPSNDPEHPEWELGEKDGFYDHIYLVGRGYRENTEKRGIQIVTDWLLGEAYRSTSSLLALRYQIRKKRGAYLSRYDEVRWACGEPSPEEVVPEQEIVPHWMSLEGCFGTLNSVTADLDPDFFRAAVLGGICRRAGLREERQYTASERAELVQRILAPLKQELITPVSEQELMDALGLTDDPEGWRKLWDEDTQLRAQQYLQERTETELCAQEIEAMKCRLRERFREMEQQIMMLARKDGPSAFGGLYWGYGISEKGEKVDSLHSALYDMGKEKRLEAAWRQKGIIRDAEKHLEWIDQERQTCNWFGRRLREERWFHAWIREMTQMINARITEAWHPMLFENRILRDELLEPMEKLARQIDAFQDVLKELSKFYEAQYDLLMAEPMQERDFLMPRINLAQIHPATWEWYRQQVSTMVDAADATAFRGGLAGSFEDARCEWMSMPWYLVQEECGKPRLISPDRPVPARELFEQYADDFMAGLPQPELTVKELLRVMEEQGISLEETVKLLVGKLRSRCAELYTLKPLDRFAGELLHVAPGLEEEQIRAICAVADTLGLNVFLGQSDIDHMEGVPSGPENGFWLEAESLGMELGRIEALVRWEEAYEKQIHRFGSRLHGAPPKGRMGKTTGQAGPHT